MARAQVGPTGYGGTWGILWKDFPYMEKRGGYSGPFETKELAEVRAREIMLVYEADKPHLVVSIATVNPK